jgi:hypothetical protein
VAARLPLVVAIADSGRPTLRAVDSGVPGARPASWQTPSSSPVMADQPLPKAHESLTSRAPRTIEQYRVR